MASGGKCAIALELVSMPISLAPRRLSIEATHEYQEIYQQEFGELLSDHEAQNKGLELLNFFAILREPDDDCTK